MSVEEEEDSGGFRNFLHGVCTSKDLGSGAPCLLCLLCALIGGVQPCEPRQAGVGGWGELRGLVPVWELAPEGTRHCHLQSPPFAFGSFAFHVLQQDGRTWVLAGLCILCIHGGGLLRGRQPAPNKVVSI